jgi:hypothetical protein
MQNIPQTAFEFLLFVWYMAFAAGTLLFLGMMALWGWRSLAQRYWPDARRIQRE